MGGSIFYLALDVITLYSVFIDFLSEYQNTYQNIPKFLSL